MMVLACRTGLILAVCVSVSGCVHTPVRAFVPPPVHSPVETLDIPEPPMPELAAVAVPVMEVPDASEIDREVRRWRRKPWPKTMTAVAPMPAPAPAPPAPVPSAAAVPAPVPLASVIGELSEGGDAAAGKQQQASTILEATDRRLAELPASVTRSKKTQVNQIRSFQKKARAAVRSGDAEGAETLATKASVLLDDMLK